MFFECSQGSSSRDTINNNNDEADEGTKIETIHDNDNGVGLLNGRDLVRNNNNNGSSGLCNVIVKKVIEVKASPIIKRAIRITH